MTSEGKIKKITSSGSQEACYFLEIDLTQKDISAPASESVSKDLKAPYRLELTLCSELTNSLPREVIQELLLQMDFKQIKKGERFIQQGEEADLFYLILKGSCIVLLEKNNMLYKIAQLCPGDLVGEMAVFTGERRSASVDAQTDMDVLSMSIDKFEKLSGEYPEFKKFLSEVITKRLSTSKITVEKKIGKYVLIEKISAGGSSIIYRGTHSVLNIPVVIKMLKHEIAMDPDFIEIFSNEAKIIAQLNHPQIVKVYDIEELYRTVFIIMEYLEGLTLKEVLNNTSKLSVEKTLDITLQTCYGLEYAHRHGIIHQDINPKNLFVQSDGRIKIIDFGLACRRGTVDSNFLFPGTIYYISPEQIKGDPVDERTDIYSLGITVFEMLTGTLPVSGDNLRILINWHLNEDIHDTRSTLSDLPDELHTFFMKTIRKDPAARYKNITEIIEMLQPLAERSGLQIEQRFHIQNKMKNKMIGMFLVYQEEQQLALKRFIEDFNKNVSETGAILRITQFDDV